MLDFLWSLSGGLLTGDSPGWLAAALSAALGGGGALLFRLGVRTALLAAAVLGVVVYVGWTQAALSARTAETTAAVAQAEALSRDLDTAVEVNATNAKIAEERARQNARDMADVLSRLRRTEARNAALQERTRQNARDPDARRLAADVCPALDRWLDRLRDSGAGAAPGGANPGRPAARP